MIFILIFNEFFIFFVFIRVWLWMVLCLDGFMFCNNLYFKCDFVKIVLNLFVFVKDGGFLNMECL